MMRKYTHNRTVYFIGILLYLSSCKLASANKASTGDATIKPPSLSKGFAKKEILMNSTVKFDDEIYLKMDAIYAGSVFLDKHDQNVFYRIVEFPDEENITLLAEKISIGEEGGNYKLLNRIRLTDDNSVLPKFGLHQVDSLQFIDTAHVSGYFNSKKMKIDLGALL